MWHEDQKAVSAPALAICTEAQTQTCPHRWLSGPGENIFLCVSLCYLLHCKAIRKLQRN